MPKRINDFSEKTKRRLAERSGFVCAFPECNKITIGPSYESEEASANIGEACHIYSASFGRGARRVNTHLSGDYLKSITNGIWMCRTHAKLIDSDEETYTSELLHKWKEEAENRARQRLEYTLNNDPRLTMSDDSEFTRMLKNEAREQFDRSPLNAPRDSERTEMESYEIFKLHLLNFDGETFFDFLLNNHWAGIIDQESITVLKKIKKPLNISVHTMAIASIVVLLKLKRLGLKIQLNYQHGCSPDHIRYISETTQHYDYVITADAGIFFAVHDRVKYLKRILTCIRETQFVLMLDQPNVKPPKFVFLAEETTQQIQYNLLTDAKQIPTDMESINIRDTPAIAAELGPDQAIILIRPKAQVLLEQGRFEPFKKDSRGITFGLYQHECCQLDEPEKISFVRAFVTLFNHCSDSDINSCVEYLTSQSDFIDSYKTAARFTRIRHQA